MNRSKQRGTNWETAIANYLRNAGVLHAERRTLSGSNDRGDIAGIPGVVIEAKDVARQDLAGWWAEALKERANDHAHTAVVWAKRRGKTSPGAGYVVMDGETFVALLRAAGYIPSAPVEQENHE